MKIDYVTMDAKYIKNVTKIIKRDLLYKLAEQIMQINDDFDKVKKIEKYIERWQSREIQINYCRESLIAYLEYIKGIKKEYNKNPFIDFLSHYLKTNCKKMMY